MSIPLDLVDDLRRKYVLPVFIETGTQLGHTVEHMRTRFEAVYTIELGEELAELARQKFIKHRHVRVIQGDSGVELRRLVEIESRRALVWLDAHWSGGITVSLPNKHTPIVEELSALCDGHRRDHVIMIDDIPEFIGENGYPPLDELIDRVKKVNDDYTINIDMTRRRGILVARVER